MEAVKKMEKSINKLKGKKVKIKLPKPQPRKLDVRWPVMDTPRDISQKEFNDLCTHVKKMSTDKWTFRMMTPDFMVIT